MKRTAMLTLLVALAIALPAQAQDSASSGQKTLAATMDVYVFPTEGQTSSEQSVHEGECYNWAVQNTGTDPFDLVKQAEQQQQQQAQAQQQAENVGKGAGASGAVHGAAAGALVGAIAGDAGKGAAYGAAAGVVAGRRRGRQANAQAQDQVATQGAQAQQATAEQLENFKKAFSVCLEAKDYMVKF